MDTQAEIKKVEDELLQLILLHLKENQIPLGKARQQANDFLALLPIRDRADLLRKLKELGEKYEEANKIYVEELGKVSDNQRDITLSTMRDYIKQGNIDAALSAAKSLYKGGVN